MDPFGLEEDGLRTKSFRDEDYINRRVFLRSYPLHWGREDEEDEEESKAETREQVPNKPAGRQIKKPIKEIILSIFHWGEERVLVLRRFKHKVTFYVIACYPVGFKTPKALISA